MKRTGILSLLLAALLLFGCAAPKITLLSEHEGGVVPINDDVIATYLSLPSEEGYAYLQKNAYRATSVAHDGQNVILAWEGGEAPYTVRIGTRKDLADAEEWTANLCKLQVGLFYPETTYYWQVTDANGDRSAVGSFTAGAGVRLIGARKTLTADGVQNVRDEGGWKTEDGKTVRYGLLYRGGLFEFSGSYYIHNVIDDYGRDALNRLGIRTEIDLRSDYDYGGQTSSPLDGCAYVRYPFWGYTSIFPKSTYTESIYEYPQTTESFRKIFTLLADENAYPVYFHCLIGQDRTGSLAFLILGLLGVEYDDLVRDYELSAFSKIGTMDRSTSFSFCGEEIVTQEQAFTAMYRVMMQYYGTDSGRLSDAIAAYLITACGVTEAQIERIRAILLTE